MSTALRFFWLFACLSAALSIGLSAMAAHGTPLSAQDAQALAWALDLQRLHALGLLLAVLMARQAGAQRWTLGAGALFVAGSLLFSLNIALRLLFGLDAFRPLVPYGGMAFMAGWVALAIGGWHIQQERRL